MSKMPKQEKEREYYPLVQRFLMDVFSVKIGKCYLKITADGQFTELLKSKIPRGREIIFSFLRRGLSPDLTGFIEQRYSNDFITVEIKNKKIRLQDVYQAKMYADLFNSKYSFLFSTRPIPYEIINLRKTAVYDLLPTSKGFRLAQLQVIRNLETNEKVACVAFPQTWFPDNPFPHTV